MIIKNKIVFAISFLIGLFTLWYGGLNLFERSFINAYWLVNVCLFSWLVSAFPGYRND